MSLLLSPITIGSLTLKNRVVMSPMCMYNVFAEDGIATPFHFAHYGARAIGQVGLIMLEACAVTPDGRISTRDLGIWNTKQSDKLAELVTALHDMGSKVGVQLAHAGRKSTAANPPVAPSALAYDSTLGVPHTLSQAEIETVIDDFAQAAKRAAIAGFDMIEIHAAHGYLINQFLSPLTNQRTDQYGGTLENRYRLLGEIVQGVQEVFNGAVWVRLSADEYHEDGLSLTDFEQIGHWLSKQQVELLDISTGGITPKFPDKPIYPGYQAKYATHLRYVCKMPVGSVGLITSPELAEYILQEGDADLIFIGRELIRNPNWIMDAKVSLHDKAQPAYNASYARAFHLNPPQT